MDTSQVLSEHYLTQLRLPTMVREYRKLGGQCAQQERNFSGEHFWARGYAVSTVGFELEQVRTYIREQEAADGAGGQF
jgi:REP element-mobilizing transposase RayT